MEKPFLMSVEDVFPLHPGRPVMPTGRIERGRVRRGDEVELIGFGSNLVARVTGIDVNRLPVEEARASMNVGLLLRGTDVGAAERGQVLATAGSIEAHGVFTADITVLPEDQGGAEVLTGERLHFSLRAAAVWGAVALAQGTDALRPLHRAAVTVTLERPVALEEGQSFPFRHHGRAAGTGTVSRLPR
ncbi:EF-Tu/IF-2/RF-3 family GTPase [Streptomyces sp. NPDC048650]|uniref:EF-Tu/IF-2/RF-3 family GTPase n=1 Tax=unclassified Streptomyces TaxID=2593676 RepID=UPI003714A8A6